ncbi:MAG: hypothetical protein ACLQIJ_22380 [Polyangia bacterium]
MKVIEFFAVLPPNLPLELGAVGFIDKGIFDQRTTLGELGIKFATTKSRGSASHNHMHSSGVSVSAKTLGKAADPIQAVARGGATLVLAFDRPGSWIFSAPNTYIEQIKSLEKLEQSVSEIAKQHKWKRRWAVVTLVVRGESAVVMRSTSNKASIEISGEAALLPGDIDLTKLGTELRITRQTGSTQRFDASGDLVLLFRAHRFGRSIPGLGSRHLTAAPAKKAPAKKAPARKAAR